MTKETHDKRTGTHACDLIDRRDAIEAIDRVDEYIGKVIAWMPLPEPYGGE